MSAINFLNVQTFPYQSCAETQARATLFSLQRQGYEGGSDVSQWDKEERRVSGIEWPNYRRSGRYRLVEMDIWVLLWWYDTLDLAIEYIT